MISRSESIPTRSPCGMRILPVFELSWRPMMARIINRVMVFEAERTDCRYLGDVFARLCPVKMPGLAGQNDNAPRRIGFHIVTVERFAKSYVENAPPDRVDAIFRMLV